VWGGQQRRNLAMVTPNGRANNPLAMGQAPTSVDSVDFASISVSAAKSGLVDTVLSI